MLNLFNSMKRRMSRSENATGNLDRVKVENTSLEKRNSATGRQTRSDSDHRSCPALKALRGDEQPLADQPKCTTRGLLRHQQSPHLFQQLPPLKDQSGAEAWKLFRRKVNLCGAVVFDFRTCASRKNSINQENPHLAQSQSSREYDIWYCEIEAKRQTLQEILVFMSDNRSSAIDTVAEDIVQMVAANIFRPLPPPSQVLTVGGLNCAGDDECDNSLDPVYVAGWIHLHGVYEIFLAIVLCPELSPKISKKLVDQPFVLRLLDLFASEDPREREYLKTVTHRVYGKIMALRAFIRKAIEQTFLIYIQEHYVQHGVSELLEILGSIINGFAQPLKEEHVNFLSKCMIPLHKAKNLVMFHQQLSYCMTQYIEKDSRLIVPIVNGLLKYWPISNTPKEVLFINEAEDILEFSQAAEYPKIMIGLFSRIAQCVQSPHFQVAERSLFLWNNPKIMELINKNKESLYPIIILALHNNKLRHWNTTVHTLSLNVSKLMDDADPQLYAQCNNDFNSKISEREILEESRQRQWSFYEETARS